MGTVSSLLGFAAEVVFGAVAGFALTSTIGAGRDPVAGAGAATGEAGTAATAGCAGATV
jgi:hypothetical protein